MSEEMKIAFNGLSINDKRNQISYELLIIGELIKNEESVYGINCDLNVKNYDINRDKNLTETEMLTFIYEDVYNIQRELIKLLTTINVKND